MEKVEEKKKMIVLVPLPLQGHITPIMQLGQALNMKGFSITVCQGEFNDVNSSQHFPGFQFVIIPEILPVSQIETFGPVEFLIKLNKTSQGSFKECISKLLVQQGNDIACIIYDDLMYFSEAAAKEFNLPCIMFSTTSATHKVCCNVLSKLNANKLLIDLQDPQVENKVVENLYPITYKDFPTSGFGPVERFSELCGEVVNKRTVSAHIINTVSCLESKSLSWLQQEHGISLYPLGPLHVIASSNSSLVEEDKRCIEWLNKQKQRSVLYISLGSIFNMETKEALEMAWGLCDSNQPFLWVLRPGLESLTEEVSKLVLERGYIVKWAPQKKVLEHPAFGGFWSHCGWNSTLESIVGGVPMICRPFNGEQKLNAVCIESVWKIGIQLQGEVERGEVERAVKRLIKDDEGADMRERALVLKGKLESSVRSGGSSYNALEELVQYLSTK